ncbi:MAG: hypothetical protein ACXWQO_13595 [Bdellovibrionota bacterium]
MKTTIHSLLLLTALLGTSAHAKATGMPNTAKLLFQITGSTSSIDARSGEDAFMAGAVHNAEANIQARIEGKPVSSGMFTGEPEAAINVEYQCGSVYRVWAQPSASSRTYARGGIFDGTNTSVSASVVVNVYCVPRDFRQKVSISAMQACEKEPKQECMSKEYMEAFSKIQQTTYTDINKP